MTELLRRSLDAPYDVASNLKTGALPASWVFLLPRLTLGRVLVLGRPPAAALRRLADLAADVAVADGDRPGSPRERQADLVWVVRGRGMGRGMGDRSDTAELSAAPLRVPEGPARRASVRRVRVRPTFGEPRSATLAGDETAERWLAERGLRSARASVTLPGRLGRRADRLVEALDRRLPDRTIRIVEAERRVGPPQFITDVAAAAGVDVAGWRWAFAAPGDYSSQKVLFLIGPTSAREPELIVKLPRERSLGWRLRQAADGLDDLSRRGLADSERVPRVAFRGRHAGFEVVGESVLLGRPIRRADDLEAATTDAAAWLTSLAERSVTAIPGPTAAAPFGALVDRFAATHPGRLATIAFLRQQVNTIEAADAIPQVFQHGDPGLWNLIRTPTGQVGFLDWENADPAGVGLWDVFYLLRSFAAMAVSRSLSDSRLDHVRAAFLGQSRATPLIVETVRAYRQRLRIAAEVIEPLYHLAWAFQTLKEASRLERQHVGRGHFLAFLEAGIEMRAGGALEAMFHQGEV